MLGLFGTLDLGTRSLQTQQQGVEVAGHNIANVNNPTYTRQRLNLQSAAAVTTSLGPQGSGVTGAGIERLRSEFLDSQVQRESSVTGFLEAQQSALQLAQSALGESVNRQGAVGAASGSLTGISTAMNKLFSAFQAVAADPGSLPDRQALVAKASELAGLFNTTDQRLAGLQINLNENLAEEAEAANTLLTEIAELNRQIARLEATGPANDLRDTRQQKLEELSKLVPVNAAEDDSGQLTLSVAGTTFVSGAQVVDTLETYDAGGGQMLVRARNAATPLNLTGGSLAGIIEVRDGEIAALRQGLDSVAGLLIQEVNTLHRAGYSLNGTTGADFFTGTGAADIAVNAGLKTDPRLFQASGSATAAGDNQVALALGALADKSHPGLNNQTFAQGYGTVVGQFGQALTNLNSRLEDQGLVQTFLARQRDSVSGVSLDEEMTSMMKFQTAYQASARLITVIDEMLDALVAMKR